MQNAFASGFLSPEHIALQKQIHLKQGRNLIFNSGDIRWEPSKTNIILSKRSRVFLRGGSFTRVHTTDTMCFSLTVGVKYLSYEFFH